MVIEVLAQQVVFLKEEMHSLVTHMPARAKLCSHRDGTLAQRNYYSLVSAYLRQIDFDCLLWLVRSQFIDCCLLQDTECWTQAV